MAGGRVESPLAVDAFGLSQFGVNMLDLLPGTWFPWHEHELHQLVWSARGVVAVNVGDAHWVLPPTRAVWLPAGIRHRTGAVDRAGGIAVRPP